MKETTTQSSKSSFQRKILFSMFKTTYTANWAHSLILYAIEWVSATYPVFQDDSRFSLFNGFVTVQIKHINLWKNKVLTLKITSSINFNYFSENGIQLILQLAESRSIEYSFPVLPIPRHFWLREGKFRHCSNKARKDPREILQTFIIKCALFNIFFAHFHRGPPTKKITP